MKVVLALALLGLAVALIDADGNQEETALEGPMEQTRGGDLQSYLLEKRVISPEGIAAVVEAATEAAKFIYDITKDGINLIWKLTGMDAKPYVHMISFELNSAGVWESGWLQDGDKIRISTKPDPNPSKSVKFTLKSASGWWKALTLHRDNVFYYEVAYTQDGVREFSNNVEYRDILENYLVLSKAKAFGVHANMYWIQNSYDMNPEYEWTIEWLQD